MAGVTGTHDFALPFLLHNGAMRGRLVRLDATITEILGRHAYPPAVSRLVAETAALAVALADALKYDGVFTLQAQGSGPVRQLVADVTSDGTVRACATFDDEAAAALPADGEPPTVQRLLGTGHLAFTVDQGPETHRYQGVVELTGTSLADCVHTYFRQSEQLETALKVVAEPPHGDGDGWRASALMLQRMPADSAGHAAADAEDQDEAWRTAVILMGSATAQEMLDPALPARQLLIRLFHEEALGVAEPKPLHFGCRCSRDKVAGTLASFDPRDLREMKTDDGHVSVVCRFCSTEYLFDDDDLAALPRAGAAGGSGKEQ